MQNNNVVSNSNNNNNGRVNTTQACAACKYQRRKCAPDCILSPYFPHDRQRQFLNAHKLFGVSNITKIIRNLDQSDKDSAMRTIIFQSDVRAGDPVGGCYRIISQLQRQIDYTKAELDLVLHQLALCRAQAQAHAQQQQMLAPDHHGHDHDAADSTANNCDIFFGMEALGCSYEQFQLSSNYHHFQPRDHHHLEQQYETTDHDHHQYNENVNATVALHEVTTTNSWGIQGSTASSILIPITTKQQQECNNVFKPLFEALSDDPQDFTFESEQTIHDSDREQTTLKNDQVDFKEEEGSFHCVVGDHHDLKGAASLFSLTKCNT